MPTNAPLAAIDLGTSTITTVVGETNEQGALQILGIGVASSQGIERAQVTHVAQATKAISESIEHAERSSGRQILSAGIAVSGPHLESLNNAGVVAIPDLSMPIEDNDLQRVIDAGQAVALDGNRTILHAIPRFYMVDGQDRVADPRGMHGQRLDVELHIVTAVRGAVQNAVQCVSGAGVDVELVAAQPVVSASYLVRPDEAAQGAIVVDIGAGSTDIVVYQDGAIAFTASLAVGGEFITRDLMVGLHVPAEVAEAAKMRYGHAIPDRVPHEPAELPGFGEDRRRAVSKALIAEIVNARLTEIARMVLGTVRTAQLPGPIAGGIVLAGGGAKLPGTAELFAEGAGLPARIAQPGQIYGLSDQVADASAASAVGLLLWMLDVGAADAMRAQRVRAPGPGLGSLMRGFRSLGRAFMPS